MTLHANPVAGAAFSHFQIHGIRTVIINAEAFAAEATEESAERFALVGRYGRTSGRIGFGPIGEFPTRRDAEETLAAIIGPLTQFDLLL